MSIYTIEKAGPNWHTVLSQLIALANNGDTIVVDTQAMLGFAEQIKTRQCPNKRITFQLKTDKKTPPVALD